MNAQDSSFFSRVAQVAAISFYLCSTTLACQAGNPPLVKAKVIALSPKEYAGKKLRLEGRVVEAGPMGAFFILEDESGRTFVSGASLAGSVRCEVNSSLAVVGEPKRYEGQGYFDAEKVVTCSR